MPKLVIAWFLLWITTSAAWAGARQDCEKLSGDAAIKACDKVIRKNPKDHSGYLMRADAYEAKGDYDRAIADHSKAIELDPKNSFYATSLGVVEYCKGEFKGSASDLLRAVELEDDVYAMLFRYLARTRAGEAAEAELEANAGRVKTKEWPYAVTELYLGKRLPVATLDAAVKPDHHCEAQLYIGQWHVLKGNAADAETALKVAVETCPKNFIEHTAAVAELKRLKP